MKYTHPTKAQEQNHVRGVYKWSRNGYGWVGQQCSVKTPDKNKDLERFFADSSSSFKYVAD